jgi:hypothetical protein
MTFFPVSYDLTIQSDSLPNHGHLLAKWPHFKSFTDIWKALKKESRNRLVTRQKASKSSEVGFPCVD